MEKDDSAKQVAQCLRILNMAGESWLCEEEKAIVKEAVCEYFPVGVVDLALAELIQKSRS
ncbi:hypothetical protein ACP6H1_21835 [Vibrio harveyi]|uniref:hypothetical protein n=1 Tax=Vibrio harveyi TaxID=669 RepID=UPI003CF1A4B0